MVQRCLKIGKTVDIFGISQGEVWEKEMSYSVSMWRKDDVESRSWDEFDFVVVAKMEVTDVSGQDRRYQSRLCQKSREH